MANYNGYANYETWNVALWMGNDEGLYMAAREHRKDHGRFTAASADAFVSELMPDGTPDFSDMGKARCYAKVKWSQVAAVLNEF